MTGKIINETRVTLKAGINLEEFLTPNSDNKPSSSPFILDVNSTNETKSSVSANVKVNALNINVDNTTSTDTNISKNSTTITIGKDKSGIFVGKEGVSETIGVKAEKTVSSGNYFTKFEGEISIDN